jgi:mannosylglucosylglycerate synthase
MNVALLHYSAPPVVGGVESVLDHHARLMADAGYQASVLAGRGEQVDPRIPFVHLPLANSRHPEVLAVKAHLDAGIVPPEFSTLAGNLLADLSAHLSGVDLLIAHNVCSLNKNLALTAALKQLSGLPGSPRFIAWHHDLAWTTPRYQDELHEGYPWDLLRTAWPGVEHVVVSELRRTELRELLGLPDEAIAVIPNGVDLARFFKFENQTRSFIQRLDLLNAEPLLLLPVRITRRKNIELAIRTLGALREKYPRAALLITGPLGPHNPANVDYFAQLTALRSESGLEHAVHFLAELHSGFLPDAVVFDLYQLADALLMPSREEGFGIPILEAGLAGLPVFCADIPPLRSLGLEHASYFSPYGDPEQIAGLIASRLSGDPTFGLRARVRQGFTWEQVFRRQIQPFITKSGGR